MQLGSVFLRKATVCLSMLWLAEFCHADMRDCVTGDTKITVQRVSDGTITEIEIEKLVVKALDYRVWIPGDDGKGVARKIEVCTVTPWDGGTIVRISAGGKVLVTAENHPAVPLADKSFQRSKDLRAHKDSLVDGQTRGRIEIDSIELQPFSGYLFDLRVEGGVFVANSFLVGDASHGSELR